MLSKIRYYVPKNTQHTIYYGLFSSILTFGSQICIQIHNNNINRIIKLKNKAIRIVKFAHYRESTALLYIKVQTFKIYRQCKVVKFSVMYMRS